MLNYDEHKEEIDEIFKEGKSLCEVNQTFIKAHCWGCSSDKEMRTNCQIKTLETRGFVSLCSYSKAKNYS